MYKIGITGGIGSGKTLIAHMFEHLGIAVFYADAQARDLMHSSPEVKKALIQRYGQVLYDERGRLRRKKLAEIIFQDERERQFVNDVIHPLVGAAFNKWAGQQQSPYVLEEAAILLESGGYLAMDAIIVVTAPEEVRINRVMQRDGVDRRQVEARMNTQWPEQRRIPYANYLIYNDNKQLLIPQVLHVDKAIRQILANRDNAV